MTDTGWFFTFGYGHTLNGVSLLGRYLIVREPDPDKARAIMVATRGVHWSFQYPLAELEEQIREFGLKEITVEELTNV
jgi:hypothetical protein